MTGYSLRDRLALVAGLVGPFLVALVLVPFRTDLSRTNAALILVVVVVAVAALGSRTAGRSQRCPRRPGSTSSSPARTRHSTSIPRPTSRRRCCCSSSA